ncbi:MULTISPECIES: DJ-1/PfpI family protein [unclassified Caballeronia]|uniref:DJ-1/PfpI family protein n=1 Tax=unclassified Caballeronia TaxID=2646786 RepID=UPI00285CCB49|nr:MULTISPECIES: DJ-1/PfpI family protein [unclassified Caballeronia]MDR5825088.1 DJ-1/PfpI family protein [Caballeronia sp. LZ043]MDR5882962.1 DJ-1/PfpI family protein [Caballeronia sp. LZ032]
MTLNIGLLLFPRVQQLDMTGPYDVFAQLADARVHLVAKTREPVKSSAGMILTPDTTFDDCPSLDVICIPGGAGVGDLMEDDATLAFVQSQAANARYVTSVCTGSLVLGAAGLLRGKRATTHWAYHALLAELGAVPVQARVVRDGNLFTGGGVTAGIDFALTLVAELVGESEAQAIQLQLEYAPAPPFDAGDPALAPASVLERVQERSAPSLAARSAIVARVAERLGLDA